MLSPAAHPVLPAATPIEPYVQSLPDVRVYRHQWATSVRDWARGKTLLLSTLISQAFDESEVAISGGHSQINWSPKYGPLVMSLDPSE